MISEITANIIILNYNGRELLPKCLPSIVEAASNAKTPTKVTILDNLSPDPGTDYVAKNFPNVQIKKAKVNKVLCSYNDFMAEISEPIAILLNNDIRVDSLFIDPLIEPFLKDPETFLVAPQVKNFDGTSIEAAKTIGYMRYGLFWCQARYPGYEKEAHTPSETLSSGFGAFDRVKFLKLGGYDERFLPGIMEDVDLCLRAKRQGYRLFYEPRSIVYHMGQASFKKKFGIQGIQILAHRNNFLFMWKNFSGFKFWITHLCFLPFRVLLSLLKGKTELLLGLIQAAKIRNRA